MTRKEIKRTIEEVVRVEYIAEDGEVFYNEEECKKYEESALFAVSKKLKRLNENPVSIFDLYDEGSCEDEVEIFDIQTDEDLENLRRYLYLEARKNGASQKAIENMFEVFENVTKGHEVIICWSYDKDWFWTRKDGSIEGYLEYLRENMTRLIEPKTEE